MKVIIRNIYNESIPEVEYNNAEVVEGDDYKTFSVIVDDVEIATYSRTAGMGYDIIKEAYTCDDAATDILENKEKTSYYNGAITVDAMREMFHGMHFGEAETKCIIAALTLTGAKWATVERH